MSLPRQDTVCIVLAHGAARDTVDRHLPLWEAVAEQVAFVTPCDAQLSAGFREYSVGVNAKYGPENNRRVQFALALGLRTQHPYIMLTEYDAVLWSAPPADALPAFGQSAGPLFTGPQRKFWHWEGKDFAGRSYMHFPQIHTRASARAILAAMDKLPMDAEHGLADRYMGLAIERAGVKVNNWLPRYAYTKDTLTLDDVAPCRDAIAAGAFASHGLKSADVLNGILAK